MTRGFSGKLAVFDNDLLKCSPPSFYNPKFRCSKRNHDIKLTSKVFKSIIVTEIVLRRREKRSDAQGKVDKSPNSRPAK